jgi:hypothetical protein
MATSTEPSSPSGTSLDTDPAAIAAAAALEMTTHASLSVDATYTAADTAAIDDEDDDSNNVQIPPRVAGTTSKQVTTSVTVISSAAKLSLCAFEGDKWLLSKALPRGNEFLSGLLRKIVRLYSLIKVQVAC